MTTCPDYQATGKEPFYPFPRTFWTTPLGPSPKVAENSAQLVSNLVSQISTEYGTVNMDSGPSRYVVHGKELAPNTVMVRQPREESGPVALSSVPLPPELVGGPGTDAEVIIWDVQFEQVGGFDGPISYEFWGYGPQASANTFMRGPADGSWDGVFPWSAEPTKAANTTSASGIAYAGGLITYAEALYGTIGHMLGLTVGKTSSEFVAPAMQSDGNVPVSSGGVPYGTVFFFPPDVPEPGGLSSLAKMVFVALKTYGMIAYDQTQGYGCDLSFENKAPWDAYKPGLEWPYDPGVAYSVLNGIPWSSLAVLAP